MNPAIQKYNDAQLPSDKTICDMHAQILTQNLTDAENKIWHGHPVWFLAGNPMVGYNKLKHSIRLLFWSGQSFDEPILTKEGTFKSAQVDFTSVEQINESDLIRLLQKSREIQWDYKNIVKRKGTLERLL